MDGQARKKLFSEVPVISGSRLCLKPLGPEHTGALQELVQSDIVYRYLPTFLYERKYADVSFVIDHLYNECFRESIILGIFEGGSFCGLAEMYGYREPIHKVSVGYRLLERCWGKGIASEALRMMVNYLYNETETEIITASTMVENLASARVLTKNGFSLVVHAADEDWGYDRPTVADKWIR